LAAVIFLLILLPLTNVLRGQSPRRGVPHLAIRLCRFTNEENPELLLELRGRSPGLIGWSLSDNGAETNTQPGVLVTEDHIQFIQRTFSASTQHSIPIGEIASAHTAYERPFWSLFMACFFSIASAIIYSYLGPIAAIAGGLFVLSFSLHFLSAKHVRLTVETRGGVVLSYGFRGNWAERQSVSPELSGQIMKVLEKVMAIAVRRATNPGFHVNDNVFRAPRFKEKRVKVVSGAAGDGSDAKPAWAKDSQSAPKGEEGNTPASMQGDSESHVTDEADTSPKGTEEASPEPQFETQDEATNSAPGAQVENVQMEEGADEPNSLPQEPEGEPTRETTTTENSDGSEETESVRITEDAFEPEAEPGASAPESSAEPIGDDSNEPVVTTEDDEPQIAETDLQETAPNDDPPVEVEQEANVEAEQLAAEEAAKAEAEQLAAAEAARIEAEQQAAAEAARIEAERLAAAEAARIEAERLAVEEAARIEAERVAAEEAARIEAERIAAEEAARIEAERLAAEAAALAEAERAAAAEVARQEAERLAAAEAALALERQRKAAAEAALALEEAERRAAEATALQLEAERLAAEAMAAKAEAERRAAARAAIAHAEALATAAYESQVDVAPLGEKEEASPEAKSQMEIPSETYRTPEGQPAETTPGESSEPTPAFPQPKEAQESDSPPSETVQQVMAHAAHLAGAPETVTEAGIEVDEATMPNSPLVPPPLPPKG